MAKRTDTVAHAAARSAKTTLVTTTRNATRGPQPQSPSRVVEEEEEKEEEASVELPLPLPLHRKLKKLAKAGIQGAAGLNSEGAEDSPLPLELGAWGLELKKFTSRRQQGLSFKSAPTPPSAGFNVTFED